MRLSYIIIRLSSLNQSKIVVAHLADALQAVQYPLV